MAERTDHIRHLLTTLSARIHSSKSHHQQEMKNILNLLEDNYVPLYDSSEYGQADACAYSILEKGCQRAYTKVRYRITKDSAYRYQAFYSTSGAHTAERGTWFPCDGIVMRIIMNGDKDDIFPWIVKLADTKTSKMITTIEKNTTMQKHRQYVRYSEKDRDLSKRFGVPYFFFLSSVMAVASGKTFLDPETVEHVSILLDTRYPFMGKADIRISDWSPIELKLPDNLDQDQIINRFIGDALSINHLYNLPEWFSSNQSEYDRPDNEQRRINLNQILDGKQYVLSPRFNIRRRLNFKLGDHAFIPEFVLRNTFVHINPLYDGFLKKYKKILCPGV